jgi:hypothetical protein
MRKELERLPNSKTKIFYERLLEPTYEPPLRDRDEERNVLAWLRGLVHRNTRIDLDDLSEKLERLAGFVDAPKKRGRQSRILVMEQINAGCGGRL